MKVLEGKSYPFSKIGLTKLFEYVKLGQMKNLPIFQNRNKNLRFMIYESDAFGVARIISPKSLILNLFLCLIWASLALINPNTAHAQTTSLSVGVSYDLTGENILDGDIICAYEQGYTPCNAGYDPKMYGLVSANPAVSLQNTTLTEARSIITTGKAIVRVSSQNGIIKSGDFVTSSPKAGIAMKADKSGYVLGTALEDYSDENPDNTGDIVVSIGIRPAVLTPGAAANLLELIKQGIDAAFYSPISALRYILAAFVVSSAFILGFVYFGRVARTGVESLGRNPLASKTIQFGIFVNAVLMFVIVGVGVGIAYLILIL